MYRLTRKAAAVRRRFARDELPADEQRQSTPLPDLRRRVIVIDYDTGAPVMHVIELHRTTRVDSYRAVVDGRKWHDRIGWSRVLDGLRRALPRMMSERAMPHAPR